MFTSIILLYYHDTSQSPVRLDDNPSFTAEETEAQGEVTPKFAQLASGGRSQSLDPSCVGTAPQLPGAEA